MSQNKLLFLLFLFSSIVRLLFNTILAPHCKLEVLDGEYCFYSFVSSISQSHLKRKKIKRPSIITTQSPDQVSGHFKAIPPYTSSHPKTAKTPSPALPAHAPSLPRADTISAR